MGRERLLGCLAALVVSTAIADGCQKRDRSGRPRPLVAAGGQGGGGGLFDQGGGPCVQTGVCGHEVHSISFDAPNVYFFFDRSGSMAEPSKDGSSKPTRYAVVREAALSLVESLGPLINVGAAAFPAPSTADDCATGVERLPVTPGDPFDGDGETLAAFAKATDLSPQGGTPISSTLTVLGPTLAALDGHTIVLLLTDGGPNCNPSTSCTPDECQPVLEGTCDTGDDCCEPDHPWGGVEQCIDREASVAAVQAIHDAGIDVYVIGVPSLHFAEFYDTVLNEMAVAGGTANASQQIKYTKVDDLDTLAGVLSKIAAEAISCEILLGKPPTEKDFTNVYFGCDVVPYDPANGWTWKGDDTVWLHGTACAELKSGTVTEVQVVTGCPTEKPK